MKKVAVTPNALFWHKHNNRRFAVKYHLALNVYILLVMMTNVAKCLNQKYRPWCGCWQYTFGKYQSQCACSIWL